MGMRFNIEQRKVVKKCRTTTPNSISLKLNGKVGWKQSEITKACKVLGLALTEIPAYFFVVKVQY